MIVNADYARNYIEDISRRLDTYHPWGMTEISDRDEDYVFDALFDVPN